MIEYEGGWYFNNYSKVTLKTAIQLLAPSIIFTCLGVIILPDLIWYWWWVPIFCYMVGLLLHFSQYLFRIPVFVHLTINEIEIFFLNKTIVFKRELLFYFKKTNGKGVAGYTICSKSGRHVFILVDSELARSIDEWEKVPTTPG